MGRGVEGVRTRELLFLSFFSFSLSFLFCGWVWGGGGVNEIEMIN